MTTTSPAPKPTRSRAQRRLERKHAPRVKFPRKLRCLWRQARYKIFHGGRGGAKSWGIARALLLMASQRTLRILCAREYMNSIADSVHALLEDQIKLLGLEDDFDVQNTTIIHKETGSQFIFSGLNGRSLNSVKSKEGIDIVWVEEAQNVSAKSWRVLTPTIRKRGSEIWVSFNPEHEEDPTYQRFVVNPPPGAIVVEIGWQDNPWLPKELRDEKDHDYATDPEMADHTWGGKPLRFSSAQVLRGKYVVQSFEPEKDWHGPYQGQDYGFATTPMAFVRCWVHKRKLYIEYEATGLEIANDDLPAKMDTIPKAREHVTRGDCSRPETINHLKRHGYSRVIPCTKRKGFIEDGVEHLRSYEQIVIHPRCELAQKQARLWSFKVDALTGDVKPDLDDKNDDVWDAVRYALELVIQRGKPVKAEPKPKPKAPDYAVKKKDRSDRWRWM